MKKNALSVLGILVAIILLAKISGWFLNYSEKTNIIINSLMFIVIGIYYLIFGIALTELKLKITLIISGIFLICMSFLPNNIVLSIIGMACMIIPMLLAKYSKEFKRIQN
jgi:hypothetical protein